ncbi:MAG: hypothetical protein ABWJ42_05680 [Sulfolobales archaeon]
MKRINIYIVTYDNEVIEEVEKTLSTLSRVIKKSRSSVVPQFYYYRVETEDPEKIDSILREFERRELISWHKVEVSLSE